MLNSQQLRYSPFQEEACGCQLAKLSNASSWKEIRLSSYFNAQFSIDYP